MKRNGNASLNFPATARLPIENWGVHGGTTMRSHAAFGLFLFLFLRAIVAHAAELTVPGMHATIQQAVDAAAEGDVVVVSEGEFKEHLLLRSGVTVRGAGRGKTILRADVAQNPVVGVKAEVVGASVEGMSIRPLLPVPMANKAYVLVEVAGKLFTLKDCEVTGAPDTGVWVRDGATATVINCALNNCASQGMWVRAADADVQQCTFEGSRYGLGVVEDAGVTVSDSTFSSQQASGLYARLCKPSTFTRCKFENNAENGAEAEFMARLQFTESVFIGHSLTGVLLSGGSHADFSLCNFTRNRSGVDATAQATAFLEQCRAYQNNYGARAYYGALLQLQACDIEDSQFAGVYAASWDTFVVVEDSTIHYGQGHGVMVTEASTAEVCGNKVTNNMGIGLFVHDEGSTLQADGNTLEANAQGDSDTHEGLPANRQMQAGTMLIGYWFAKGDFDRLEKMEQRLRDLRGRNKYGYWEQEYFPTGIHTGYAHVTRNSERWHKLLDAWEKAHPDSIYPLIIRAQRLVRDGWEARGDGFADSVTKQGWKVFREKLQLAEEQLKKAEALEENDAYLYAVWIEVALGLGASKPERMKLVEAAKDIDPDFYAPYEKMQFSLMPRWGGSSEEIEAFARKANEWAGPQQGTQMYALLAIDMRRRMLDDFTEIKAFKWDLLNQGFDQLREAFPESDYYLQVQCWFSHYYKDKEKARELFALIGDDYNTSVWDREESFIRSRRWARSEGRISDTVAKMEQETAQQALEENLSDIAIIGGAGAAFVVLLGVLLVRARRRKPPEA